MPDRRLIILFRNLVVVEYKNNSSALVDDFHKSAATNPLTYGQFGSPNSSHGQVNLENDKSHARIHHRHPKYPAVLELGDKGGKYGRSIIHRSAP